MKPLPGPRAQRGSALLEALFAILIFSIGLLALVALQAVSIKNSIDAKYRSDASYVANQIIAQMWVDRTAAVLDSYAHRADAGVPVCAFTGAEGNANVTAWVGQVVGLLPGSASTKTQIQVTTPSAGTRLVKVTVCWQGPQEAAAVPAVPAHNFAVTAQINTL